jgi:hypothetical protein
MIPKRLSAWSQQPKLLTKSDYCYYDRLRPVIRDHILQPWAVGFCLLQQNRRAVLSHPPVGGGFRDEVSFRRWCTFPGGDGISFR